MTRPDLDGRNGPFAILKTEERPRVKVTVERLPESRIQLEIEVDPERLEKTLESTYRKLASKAKISGFRPGKAPRPLIMQRIGGRPGLIREALDDIVPDAYNTAIEEQDVHAIDQPDLEILEVDPVRFKATVPVRPSVDLNDYGSIHVERNAVAVTDADVADELRALRQRLALHVPVDRAANWNDFLIADIRATADGEQFVDDQGAEFPLREGATLFVPGLAEAFVGMARNESKTVELPLPEDFSSERLRGKAATFELNVREVKEEELPDEDDDLAAQVAEDLENLDALRARIREQLQSTREAAEASRVRSEALAQLVQRATLDYPRVLVEREMDHMVSEGVGNDAARYQQYLRAVGRSHAEFRETFRESAEERLRSSLVVTKLGEVENIAVDDADIDAEIDRLAGPMGEESGRFREIFSGDNARESIRRNLVTQRTFDRIVEIATSSPAPKKRRVAEKASAAPEPEAEESAAPKRRTRKKKEPTE